MDNNENWKTLFFRQKKTIYLNKPALYLLDMSHLLWFKSHQVVKGYRRLMIIHHNMYRL
jgi:hypothetical protein